MSEVDVVLDYVKDLLQLELKGRKVLQKDIGIVVPYKLQSKVIKSKCNQMNLNEVSIGTAEVFQGQERPIMIVTTVRTDGQLGFLNDERVSLLYWVIVYYTYMFII